MTEYDRQGGAVSVHEDLHIDDKKIEHNFSLLLSNHQRITCVEAHLILSDSSPSLSWGINIESDWDRIWKGHVSNIYRAVRRQNILIADLSSPAEMSLPVYLM